MKLPVSLVLSAAVALSIAGCMRVKPNESESAPSPVAEAPAPDVDVIDPYRVEFETSAGDFVVEVHPDWAPRGAARFKNLVESGFYDNTRFFRVVPGFMVQWGINGDPAVQSQWRDKVIQDDPVRQSNKRGKITFATSGPNSRTAQVFINFADNNFLDGQGFSPFGEVISGMDSVDAINDQYGEQPDQGQIQQRGNEYLNQKFPELDYIKSARVIEMPISKPAPEAKTDAQSEVGAEEKADAAAAEEKPAEANKPMAEDKPAAEEPKDDKPAESTEKPADKPAEADKSAASDTPEAAKPADSPKETIEEIQ
ncbi:peptidylprolyl isomerase [Rubinisphaera sp. JC750]|uniref:peptidylprolyl isomerase n=1 Tax=Rubinisphaera sp. JC750 TaxID=2898658 RepID=UPI001EFF6EEF|nr:peptidylprolyl isomerase [Rubinisphaera sp. JC750]